MNRRTGLIASFTVALALATESAILLTVGAVVQDPVIWALVLLGVACSLVIASYVWRAHQIEQVYWMHNRLDELRRELDKLDKRRAELEAERADLDLQALDVERQATERAIETASSATLRGVGTLTVGAPSIVDPKAARLISNIALIENFGNQVIGLGSEGTLGASDAARRKSLFSLRSELRAREIWTDEDTISFDRALQLRNAIVHGDSGRGLEALSDAVEATSRLLKNLRELQQEADRQD